MTIDSDSSRRLPTRLPNLAQTLEYNLYFISQIEMLRKKEIVSDKDIFEFRERLRERDIANISHYWDPFLRRKITSNLRLRDIMLSCAPVTPTVKNKETGEFHYVIEVFPETTQDDVVNSFDYIMGGKDYPEKAALQPIYNDRALEAVFGSFADNKKISDVQRDLSDEGLTVSLSTLYNYKKRMMQGL